MAFPVDWSCPLPCQLAVYIYTWRIAVRSTLLSTSMNLSHFLCAMCSTIRRYSTMFCVYCSGKSKLRGLTWLWEGKRDSTRILCSIDSQRASEWHFLHLHWIQPATLCNVWCVDTEGCTPAVIELLLVRAYWCISTNFLPGFFTAIIANCSLLCIRLSMSRWHQVWNVISCY